MVVISAQNDLDMHQFQILNWVCQVLSADPTSPKQGQVYFNSTSNRWRVFNGTTWDEYATVAELAADLSGKVDKVDGKGLSTEDFTTALKTKLDGIAAGAEVNVQPDWTAESGDGAILHKPTLGTAAGLDTGTAAGNIPVLNGSGKLPDEVLPPLAISELVGSVDTQAELVTLSAAQKGDIAKVTADPVANNNGVYWLNGVYSELSAWIQIVGPGSVISVNGQSGVVVLAAADVGAVPVTRQVNGKALSQDISLAAGDVGAVPTTRQVNGKALSTDITLVPSDIGAVPQERTVNGKPLSVNITLAASDVGAVESNEAITAGTHPVITYDAKGLVTGGRALAADDVPSLDAAKIGSGTMAVARLPTGNASGMLPLLGGQAQAGQALVWDQTTQRFVPQTLTTGNVNSFTGTIEGDGSKTVFTFSHGLGKAGVVQVKDSSGGQVWVANSCTATQVTVTFGTAPASGVTYTVHVVG